MIYIVDTCSVVCDQILRLMDKREHIIIAIDGPCGSGKTTLADCLTSHFNCNVFHMDDFFLPFSMRTQERLAQPGGNVHYERFKEEVLHPLQKGQEFNYRPFRCDKGELDSPVYVEKRKLNIVEGVYSLHPSLQQAYDYRIFLTVSPQVQRQRIVQRSGQNKIKDFVDRWIPMENNYFSYFKVQSGCDLVIDTSKG